MIETAEILDSKQSNINNRVSSIEKIGFFALAVLGFSFWFFVVVPFASHRESYEWLAMVQTHSFSEAFSFISVTYRPLAQGTTWFGFMLLNPSQFPTSGVRQAILQGAVYGLFLCAWWLIFSAAKEMRAFAIIALVIGVVYFPGYVHLFHIYGLFYVPVMLMLGAVLLFDAAGAPPRYESWLGFSAILLVLWHPFATAIFLGYYFGLYLSTFDTRKAAEHAKACFFLLTCTIAIYLSVVVFVRSDVKTPLATKLYGGLVTYQTNEINIFAALISLMLAGIVAFSLNVSARVKIVTVVLTLMAGAGLIMAHLPVVLLWIGLVLVKLALLRRWGLFFATLAAALLPIGAVIGTPVFGLFAIILTAYGTCLEGHRAEKMLSAFRAKHAFVLVGFCAILVVLVRAGVPVPLVKTAAAPLLQERERTYQLEQVLAWLHQSEYCSYAVDFADKSGSPIDSVENVISRQYRPPAGIQDVRIFWNQILRCKGRTGAPDETNTAIVTFRGPVMTGYESAFTVKGKYGGDATVWVRPGLAGSPKADAPEQQELRMTASGSRD